MLKSIKYKGKLLPKTPIKVGGQSRFLRAKITHYYALWMRFFDRRVREGKEEKEGLAEEAF